MATEDTTPPGPRGALSRIDSGWRWFRSRPLGVQVGAWTALAIVIAVVGLALEQQPSNTSPLAAAPDTGAVSGSGTAVGSSGSGAAGGAVAGSGESGVTPAQGQVVTNAAGGIEGGDVQQATGAQHVEVGAVKVAKNFRATTPAVTTVFNQALNNRGRAGLNANQLISVKCGKGNCLIKYVPDGPGAGRIIEAEGPIWETLLKDPTWKSATIEALPGGPDIAGRGSGASHGAAGHGGPPAVVISCTRQAVVAVGVWGTQSAPRITRLCSVGHTELKGA